MFDARRVELCPGRARSLRKVSVPPQFWVSFQRFFWFNHDVRPVAKVVLCLICLASPCSKAVDAGNTNRLPTLAFPIRPRFTDEATEWVRTIARLDRELPRLAPHDLGVSGQVLGGNVPEFMRKLCPVSVTNVFDERTNVGRFFVTPDYLAIGSDADYLLSPVPPDAAQFLADTFLCCLPTPRMVDAIYREADLKLVPAPIPPSPAMTTVPVFALHNEMVKTQRMARLKEYPLGTLVAGHKKDVVITERLSRLTNRVAIYGWHQTNGQPIQPLYTRHTDAWVDYSHGVRLVYHVMEVNGQSMSVARVLADPELCGLISDEGVVKQPRYENFTHPRNFNRLWETGLRFPNDFVESKHFGERHLDVPLPDQVRLFVNAPAPSDFATNKPVMLVLYALPNGNTIEQTIGKRLKPGDDWHFNIQHIGAQTRWLRNVLTNRTVVVAYLANAHRSWPAWRKEREDDSDCLALVKGVEATFEGWPLELVLTGHSGGGSLTFGYLNATATLPPELKRIAFLDSNYAYNPTNHLEKLSRWLTIAPDHYLCVLAYQDYLGLLDGKSFVSEAGGTWGRSLAMLEGLGRNFAITRTDKDGLQHYAALDGRLQFFLKENPDRKILHTVQVEKNGFIHAMLTGTPFESQSYEYLGERVYEEWIAE